jgi:hypothetical protein
MTKVSYIMSEINKPPSSQDSNGFGISDIPDPPGASTKPYVVGSGNDGLKSFENWLGPKGYKEFLTTLSQYISNELKRNQSEADLASRRLAAAEQGEDPGDVSM